MNDPTISFYDRMAKDYDKTVGEIGYRLAGEIHDWLHPFVTAEIPTVLDIGIGTGLASEKFAARGCQVVGVDGSSTMLDLCRGKGLVHELIRVDLADGTLPIQGRSFDVVLCIGVFEFILEPQTFLQNVSRLTSPGGIFALAIRDPDLNPQFTSMQLEGRLIDRVAYEEHQVIAVHHRWSMIKPMLHAEHFEILKEIQVLAYRSPTQGFKTMNRVVICRKRSTL